MASSAVKKIVTSLLRPAVRSFNTNASPSSPLVIPRHGVDLRDTGNALRLRQDMPGILKEDLRVWVEPKTNDLRIKADLWYDMEEEECGVSYQATLILSSFGIPLKTNEIKAELKNGVMKVLVPKVKWSRPKFFTCEDDSGSCETHICETDEVLRFRADLPGLTNKDVKVLIEKNKLLVTGEWAYDEEEEVSWEPYSKCVDLTLTGHAFKTKEVEAVIKNGVLKVLVPKLKEG